MVWVQQRHGTAKLLQGEFSFSSLALAKSSCSTQHSANERRKINILAIQHQEKIYITKSIVKISYSVQMLQLSGQSFGKICSHFSDRQPTVYKGKMLSETRKLLATERKGRRKFKFCFRLVNNMLRNIHKSKQLHKKELTVQKQNIHHLQGFLTISNTEFNFEPNT